MCCEQGCSDNGDTCHTQLTCEHGCSDNGAYFQTPYVHLVITQSHLLAGVSRVRFCWYSVIYVPWINQVAIFIKTRITLHQSFFSQIEFTLHCIVEQSMLRQHFQYKIVYVRFDLVNHLLLQATSHCGISQRWTRKYWGTDNCLLSIPWQVEFSIHFGKYTITCPASVLC